MGVDQHKQLRYCVADFDEALRWKRYPAAQQYLAPAVLSELSSRLRTVGEKIEIVEIEVLDVKMDAEASKATVVTRYAWYTASDLTVRHGVEVQRWERLGGDWLLVGQEKPPDEAAELSPFVR
jgi:hypothetical protein